MNHLFDRASLPPVGCFRAEKGWQEPPFPVFSAVFRGTVVCGPVGVFFGKEIRTGTRDGTRPGNCSQIRAVLPAGSGVLTRPFGEIYIT